MKFKQTPVNGGSIKTQNALYSGSSGCMWMQICYKEWKCKFPCHHWEKCIDTSANIDHACVNCQTNWVACTCFHDHLHSVQAFDFEVVSQLQTFAIERVWKFGCFDTEASHCGQSTRPCYFTNCFLELATQSCCLRSRGVLKCASAWADWDH